LKFPKLRQPLFRRLHTLKYAYVSPSFIFQNFNKKRRANHYLHQSFVVYHFILFPIELVKNICSHK